MTDQTIQGTLEILLIKAELTRDVATFSKMDPYVLLEYNNLKLKSLVQRSKGKKPVFNQTLTLRVSPQISDQLHLGIYDLEESGKDRFICEAEVGLKQLLKGGSQQVMLNYQAKGAGRLDIHTTFYQDVLVQEIPKRMDGEAVEGEEEKEKQSESEDDEQFQFKALDTQKQELLQKIAQLKIIQQQEVKNLNAKKEILKEAEDKCEKLRDKNLKNLQTICYNSNIIAKELKKGVTGILKIKGIKMNIQNLKTVSKKDLNLFSIFRLTDTSYSTDTFALKPQPQLKVQFLKEFEMKSKEQFTLQIEVYNQLEEDKYKFLCGNCLYLTQYQKGEEYDVKMQLYKYCTQEFPNKGTVEFKLKLQ